MKIANYQLITYLIFFLNVNLKANENLNSIKKVPLSQRLRDRADPEWQKHFTHPFLLALQNKSLAIDKWRFYIVQDYLFLQMSLKVEAFAITRTTNSKELTEFAERLKGSADFLKNFPIMHKMTHDEIYNSKFAPTNYAYTRHYFSIGSFKKLHEIVTLMLPCLWLYDDIEKKMNITFGPYPEGPRTKEQKNYIKESINIIASLKFYRAYLDNYDKHITSSEEDYLQEIFDYGVRYEYLFWQMSWTKEQWIIESDNDYIDFKRKNLDAPKENKHKNEL